MSLKEKKGKHVWLTTGGKPATNVVEGQGSGQGTSRCSLSRGIRPGAWEEGERAPLMRGREREGTGKRGVLAAKATKIRNV